MKRRFFLIQCAASFALVATVRERRSGVSATIVAVRRRSTGSTVAGACANRRRRQRSLGYTLADLAG